MNTTSQWPLTKEAIRYTTPEFMLRFLQKNPLTRACYPCAVGYYPKAIGHKMTRIKHKDNLLIYCTDGEGFVRTKYFNGKIETGDLLLLP